MKSNVMKRTLAGALAMGLCLSLVACGSSAESTSEAASSESAESTEATDDAYAYLADFSYDSIFDENGYVKDLKAGDYVTLPENFDAPELAQSLTTIDQTEVDSYIAGVMENYQTTEQVTDRAAEMGDTVNVDYVGSIDGVGFSGGNTNGSGYDLTLGSGSFIDDFEDQIAGHTPGETFDVVVTFPEDYGNEELNGKEAVFVTTLNYINEYITPDLTDEWVEENLRESMDFTTVAELQEYVRTILIFDQEANAVYSSLYEGAVFADELPETLVQYFKDQALYTPYQYSLMYGMDLDSMMQASGYESAAAYLEAVTEYVDDDVRQMLLLQAAAEEIGVVCDDNALEENFKRFYGSNNSSSYVDAYGDGYVKMTLLQDMTIQRLIDNAVLVSE